MAEDEAFRLSPEGPHSSAYTAHVAACWRQAVRVLNHATLPQDGFPGLQRPQDVFAVVRGLKIGAQELGQTFEQLDAYLAGELQHGRLDVQGGLYDGDPFGSVSHAVQALTQAQGAARALYEALAQAEAAVIGLTSDSPADP
jgi:hypothetical protein